MRPPGSKYTWISSGLSEAQAEQAHRELRTASERINRKYPSFSAVTLRARDLFEGVFDQETEEGRDALLREAHTAYLRNFEALFEFYGISIDGPAAWKLMTIILADRHIEGFRPVRTRAGLPGRPEKWLPIHELILLAWVERRRRVKPGAGVLQICRAIPADIKDALPKVSAESLRQRYQRIRCQSILRDYDAKNVSAFGDDWIEQWLRDELEIADDRPTKGGLPRLRRAVVTKTAD